MKFQAVLISAVLAASSQVSVAADNDCTIEKHMAGHALSMIKGGATLKQTIQVLADSDSKKQIIEQVYQRRDELENMSAASDYGVKLCRDIMASL